MFFFWRPDALLCCWMFCWLANWWSSFWKRGLHFILSNNFFLPQHGKIKSIPTNKSHCVLQTSWMFPVQPWKYYFSFHKGKSNRIFQMISSFCGEHVAHTTEQLSANHSCFILYGSMWPSSSRTFCSGWWVCQLVWKWTELWTKCWGGSSFITFTFGLVSAPALTCDLKWEKEFCELFQMQRILLSLLK